MTDHDLVIRNRTFDPRVLSGWFMFRCSLVHRARAQRNFREESFCRRSVVNTPTGFRLLPFASLLGSKILAAAKQRKR